MIRMLICCLAFTTVQTIAAQTNLDSLYRALDKDIQPKEYVDILIDIALLYRTSSPDSVSKYGELALQKTANIDYSLGKIRAYHVLGLAASLHSRYDESLDYYQSANNLLQKTPDEKLSADILMGIGGVLYYNSQLDSACTNFIKAASIYENIGEDKYAAPAYSNIGMIMNANDRDSEAKNYFQKALKLAEAYDLIGTKLPVLVNLAALYEKNEQYDSAIHYAQLCYDISKIKNMTYGMARSLTTLSGSFTKSGKYELGLEKAIEGKTLYDDMGNERLSNQMLYYQALAQHKLGRTKKALEILRTNLATLDKEDDSRERVYRLLSSIYAQIGDYKNALHYHQMYFDIYKKVEEKHQADAVAELQTKYETEKKNKEIIQLNSEANIQKLKIRQQYWILAGAVLFFSILISMIILFYRQRTLKKRNAMLELEQRFLRSQMNPHFIFNALGVIQKYVLKNDSMNGATFIANFSHLMREMLNQSRMEFIPISQEVSSLQKYLELQSDRFDNGFDYEINVDETIDQEQTMIPPMFAQPFVENALEHGISALKNRGNLVISFQQLGTGVSLTIIDNGVGISEKKEDSDTHQSLATTITEERIAVLKEMGVNLKMSIDNIEQGNEGVSGVRVTLELPTKQI